MTGPQSPPPSGNQFSLRGIFILITAVSVILALLALAIREPFQWLGTLGIILFCLLIIGIIELVRNLFPPRARLASKLAVPFRSPPAQSPTAPAGEGENPFAPQSSTDQSPFRMPPAETKSKE